MGYRVVVEFEADDWQGVIEGLVRAGQSLEDADETDDMPTDLSFARFTNGRPGAFNGHIWVETSDTYGVNNKPEEAKQ